MPTRRIPLKRQQLPIITPEAVQAFRAGNAMALAMALGLAPWEMNPLMPLGPEPQNWENSADRIWLSSYWKAMALRARLMAAVAE